MSTVREMIEADDFSQIAANDGINFTDFLLLTDSKVGDYGQYQISQNGVQARDLGDISSCTVKEADAIYSFYRNAKLDFPTTAVKLLEWVALQSCEFSLPEKFTWAVNAIIKKPAGTSYSVSRQRHQELEILRVIEELGQKPKALPRNEPGTPGIKAKVREQLDFTDNVFDKAWQRLRDFKDIQNQ